MSASSATTTVDNNRLGRAVVVGGSIAGSLAAAALAAHFDEVIVVDKDHFPSEADQRKGVPHGHHFHALLAGGRSAIDSLIPNFSKEALRLGAHTLSVTEDIRYRQRCGWMPRSSGDLKVLMASRPLFEWVVRDQARALEPIRYLEGTSAIRLSASPGKVTGVYVRDDETGIESELAADLVVDASGRNSKATEWLEELGYGRPSESTVNAHWGYSSVFVRVPKNWEPGFRAMYCPPLGVGAPEGGAATRGCAMWVQEGEDRWIFTVQGSAGDFPPRREQELREYVASIGVPEVDEAVKGFEFLGPIQVWRDTTNRLRNYADLDARPENFVLLGDAVTAFNPVYGQGMTVSAVGARTLQEELQAHLAGDHTALDGFAARFQPKLDGIIQYCWATSTGQDYRVPGVEVAVDGEAQPVPVAASDFSDRLLAYVAADPELYLKFMETTQLIRTPDWLQSPEIVTAIQDNWDELGKLVLQ